LVESLRRAKYDGSGLERGEILEMQANLMLETARQTPGYYLWEVPEKPVTIYLRYEVIDRLLFEVMRGFGAVPRRGAEVGGILIGSVELEERTAVKIEDFEAVPTEYGRGPSYLLSANDTREFEAALSRWARGPEKNLHAVGFYRSHTRDGLGLTDEDLTLYAKYFPHAADIALLIKPFATRVSRAGFFFREGNEIKSDSSYQEFPFLRSELGGPPPDVDRAVIAGPGETRPGAGELAKRETSGPEAGAEPLQPVRRKANLWIPLAFIFFIAGILLGFRSGVHSRPPEGASTTPDQAYAIDLLITKQGENLHVKWNRQVPIISKAQKGHLSIEDGEYRRDVDLDRAQLLTGSVIYRHLSPQVRFKLEIFANDRVSLSETQEFRAAPNGAKR
jgi:hypothetical protein